MSQSELNSKFVRRFNTVWSKIRRVQLGQILSLAALCLIVGLASLTLIDYWYELSWSLRAVGLTAVGIAGIGLSTFCGLRLLRNWSRPQTAVEIEDRFPQLGQSVRTTIQYGGQEKETVRSEGVEPNLVDALEVDTARRTLPLPLDVVVPVRRLKAIASLLAVSILVMLGSVAMNWEWRTATQRALLGNSPYTELAVSPGNTLVEEGDGLILSLELTGRTNRQVVLYSRPVDHPEAEWDEREILLEELNKSDSRSASYEVELDNIRKPMDYHVVAGPARSDVFHVDVRYPIHITEIKITTTPPEYTGLESKTVEDGHLNVVEGTKAAFQFTLDRQPLNASLVLSDKVSRIGRKNEKDAAAEIIPLKVDENVLSIEMDLVKNKSYSIVATSQDGTELAENNYRIRVRKDQAPRVSFEAPDEALEVHSLAEILMRIRVRDDFGLTKSGIVFEVNNEEEHQLLSKDFQEAAEEVQSTGHLSKTTRANLDKVLPLEYFQLTQKDSVAYYAFAEDNFPGRPKRTETDLRFIDIRPFKRTYRLVDPQMPGDAGFDLVSLDELIGRQRFALNRAMRLSKLIKQGDQPDLNTIDSLVEFETKLANSARELAEFIGGEGVDGSDLLFQAVESMLGAVDSLSTAKIETAVLQEKDALRYLIEGRNKIEFAISKEQNQALLQRLRAFDRTQAQKLRRPENDEENVEQVLERLQKLAEDEEFVYKTLAGILMEQDSPPLSTEPMDPEDPQDIESSGSGSKSAKGKGKGKQQRKSKEKGKNKKPEGDEGDSEEKESEDASGKGDDKDGEGKEGAEGEEGTEAGQGGEGENGRDGGDGKGKDTSPGLTREEIVEKQIDIKLEARDLERIIENLEGLTDLARTRMTKAAESTENVSGALERGDTKSAAETARAAAGQIRELTRHMEALLAPETAQQIAQARNMSDELARLQRELGDRANPDDPSGTSSSKPEKQSQSKSPGSSQKQNNDPSDQKQKGSSSEEQAESSKQGKGKGKPSQKSEEGQNGRGSGPSNRDADPTDELVAQAQQLAESGKTLKDVLGAILVSENADDADAIRKVDDLTQEQKISETIQRIQDLPPAISKERPEDVQSESMEIADKMEVFAQRLDEVHRSIVMPRVEELMVLERKATELQRELDQLETNRQVTDWHADASELLKEMKENSVGRDVITQMENEMRKAGWRENRRVSNWNWQAVGVNTLTAPATYSRNLVQITEELQAQIQELLVGDHLRDNDEAVPPQYKLLVERYYEALSSAGRESN